MYSPKKRTGGRTTLLIWSISLAVYAVVILIAYECDFLRFSHYSVEELQAQKQANEKKNAELRKNMQVEKKKPPEDELKKILDRRERKEKESIRKQIDEVEDVLEQMKERTEELKEIYQARRIPEWEAYERILAIADYFGKNPVLAVTRSIRDLRTNARMLTIKLNSLDKEEVPPVFPQELNAMLGNSTEFRERDAALLESADAIAPAVWRATEMERLIRQLLGKELENKSLTDDIYALNVMNTPPEMPDADASIGDLEEYLGGVQEQLETANAELNTYLNAIRNMQSVDRVMDAASAQHFAGDIREELERQGTGLQAQVDHDMRRAENAMEFLDDLRENLQSTHDFYQELLDKNQFGTAPVRQSYLSSMRTYEKSLEENRKNIEYAGHAMEQAKRAEETFDGLMESQDYRNAAKYADFIRQAAQDIVNTAAQREEGKPAPKRLLDELREESAAKARDASAQLNRQLDRLAAQNTGENESSELAEAIETMRSDVQDAVEGNREAVENNDTLGAWEQEQRLEQLQSAMRNNAQQSRSGNQGQQGGRSGQQGGQSGQSGQQGGVSQEEFLRAMEQMESLGDRTESLQNRAGSIARNAGLDMPLSAQRLFTALQNQALQRAGQQGGQSGQQGGQQGRSGLPGMMERLGRMQRQGSLGGQQGRGGQGQGRQGPGQGNQSGQGGSSGIGVSRGTFDFPYSEHVSGRIGELLGASAGKTGADPGIIAESIPGRRFSADAQRHGIVFLDSWYVIGPWESNGEEFSKHVAQEPETIIDLDATYLGKTDPATGKPIKLRWHYVQTDTICVRPPMKMEEAYYYAYTDVFFEEPTDAVAVIGTDDAGKIWVNKQVVWEDDGLSTWALTEGILNVHFNKGWNSILIAVQNGPDECQFSFAIVGTAKSE